MVPRNSPERLSPERVADSLQRRVGGVSRAQRHHVARGGSCHRRPQTGGRVGLHQETRTGDEGQGKAAR